MSVRLMTIVEKIYQFLHAGDVSLAVKINADSLNFVVCRRWLARYQIKTVTNLPLKDNMHLGKQILTVKKTLGIKPHFTTILLPQTSTLLKKVTIPLMRVNEIPGYLFQHANRFLLPGISAERFSLHYKILEATDTELTLLVLLQHRHVLEKYRQELNQVEAFQIIAGNTVLDNLLTVSNAKFSGVLVDLCNADVLMLFYRAGKFTALYSGKVDNGTAFEREVRASMNTVFGEDRGSEEYHYLISRNEGTDAGLVTFFENEGLQPFHQELPFPQNSYLSTAAACLNPFVNREDKFDMLDGKSKERRNEAYYQHLLKKSVLLFGGMLMLILLTFSITEGMLKRAMQAENFRETSLQPLIRERDSLNVNYTLLQEKIPEFSVPVQRESNSANYLFQIAESLPQEIWLTSAEILPAGEEKISIQIAGLSPAAEVVSQWMQLLEELGFSKNVTLLDISLLESGKIKRKWQLPYQELTQFRIRLDAQL